MTFLDLLLGAGLALAATSAGAALVTLRKFDSRLYPIVVSFSAGVMGFSAVEMFTGSHDTIGHMAFGGLLVGIIFFLAVDKLLPHAHFVLSSRCITESKRKAALVAGTITLHNIPEGFAIASAFAGSPQLGWLVASSIALQDIPEGLIVSAPLICYGVKTRNSLFWGVFSGVVEFAAAVFGYLLLAAASAVTPLGLAFSSGAMSYVVLFELLPDAIEGGGVQLTGLSVIGGAATALLLSSILGL